MVTPAVLLAYLHERGIVAPADEASVEPLRGGVSNLTLLVRLHGGPDLVVKQSLARLRVDSVWRASRERIFREAAALRWLNGAVPGSVPAFRFEDRDMFLLGMDAVPEPFENWKARLLRGVIEPELVEAAGTLLAKIHCAGAGRLVELAEFADRSYFEELRLSPYYERAATVVPEASPFLCDLVAVTRARTETFVHGDFSPKNILVRNGSLVLLDHEVAHLGDPAFDVGFALTHLLSKAHHLPAQRHRLAESATAFWAAYVAGTGGATADLARRVVHHTLACMLARVAGRSPLEYLDADERRAQKRAVLAMLHAPPSSPGELAESFLARVQ